MAEINVNIFRIYCETAISLFARQINKNQRVFERQDVISTRDSQFL